MPRVTKQNSLKHSIYLENLLILPRNTANVVYGMLVNETTRPELFTLLNEAGFTNRNFDCDPENKEDVAELHN